MPWEPWQTGVTNAMEAMAKKRPWQKHALDKWHIIHGKKGNDTHERNPFRAALCFKMLNHRESS